MIVRLPLRMNYGKSVNLNMPVDSVTISRRADNREVCILVAGAQRGIFFPAEVLEWLQAEGIAWTVRGDRETITFTIPAADEMMLFKIRFAHLRQ